MGGWVKGCDTKICMKNIFIFNIVRDDYCLPSNLVYLIFMYVDDILLSSFYKSEIHNTIVFRGVEPHTYKIIPTPR